MHHVTVMLQEAVDSLAISPTSTVVDATYGAGGHSRLIAEQLGPGGRLIALDTDAAAFSGEIPVSVGEVRTVVCNFRNLSQVLAEQRITHVDAVLADLGWRLEQFMSSGRGFSFTADEPLLMTFGEPDLYSFTAYDIVNEWKETAIADVLYGYSDERFARRIARKIVSTRQHAPITTARQLAMLVEQVYQSSLRTKSRIHPATKTFQALRIAVNDELSALKDFLGAALTTLHAGGRLSVITFHSLEDRIVKHTFREWEQSGLAARIHKKPRTPTEQEKQENFRSRSAKLRTISKQ